jgi:GMP synthase (glutamine-hydrolysing)
MSITSLHALVLSHVCFEDLGTLEKPLLERGFHIASIEAAKAHFPLDDADSCDLLVIMGGPIGVYEQDDYPFLKDEIACISQRLRAGRPTLGICLGAQLMAAALGASVYPGKRGKEIGWAPITGIQDSKTPAWFAPLLTPDTHLLHWHGDTFDLPSGAVHLAKTELYDNQAFTYGGSALGLQFHPEVTASGLESWYVGHAAELHQANISIPALRAASEKHAPKLEKSSQLFWNLWLDYIL